MPQKRNKRKVLGEADYHLERLKIYNRLSMKMKLLSFNQYEHLAGRLDDRVQAAVQAGLEDGGF